MADTRRRGRGKAEREGSVDISKRHGERLKYTKVEGGGCGTHCGTHEERTEATNSEVEGGDVEGGRGGEGEGGRRGGEGGGVVDRRR